MSSSGADTLDGGRGADTLIGGAGDDVYIVDTFRDEEVKDHVVEAANGGIDTIKSQVISLNLNNYENIENIELMGRRKLNAIGDSSDNLLVGNSAANLLQGGAGADTLDGGLGSDTLTGGEGDDRFIFSSALSRNNIDTITDFVSGLDKLVLDSRIFTAFTAVPGTQLAVEANEFTEFLVFDAQSKKLYYDSNGSSTGGLLQFATFTPNVNLSASDFLII